MGKSLRVVLVSLGSIVLLFQPVWRAVGWLSDLEFLVQHKTAILAFLASGWGVLATTTLGVILIILAMRILPPSNVIPTVGPPPTVVEQTHGQPIKSAPLVDRLETLMAKGGDIVEGLQRLKGVTAPSAMGDVIWAWGQESYRTLKGKYPGYAAFFLSDLPSSNDLVRRDLWVGYMNRRMGDLRAVIERESQH